MTEPRKPSTRRKTTPVVAEQTAPVEKSADETAKALASQGLPLPQSLANKIDS